MDFTKNRFFITVTMGIALAIFITPHLNAQWSVGIESGINKNYMNTNISNLSFTQYKGSYNYSISIPIAYQFNSWLSVKAEPGIMKKSYKIERTGYFTGIYERFDNSYLQLPIMASFSFGGSKLKGFVNIGGYGGYWTGGHVKGAIANILDPVDSSYTETEATQDYSGLTSISAYSEKYTFDKKKDNRYEWGILAGGGISYQINRKWKIFTEAMYYQSLTDQQKKYMINQVPRYNETYALSLGFMMQLGKDPKK